MRCGGLFEAISARMNKENFLQMDRPRFRCKKGLVFR